MSTTDLCPRCIELARQFAGLRALSNPVRSERIHRLVVHADWHGQDYFGSARYNAAIRAAYAHNLGETSPKSTGVEGNRAAD